MKKKRCTELTFDHGWYGFLILNSLAWKKIVQHETSCLFNLLSSIRPSIHTIFLHFTKLAGWFDSVFSSSFLWSDKRQAATKCDKSKLTCFDCCKGILLNYGLINLLRWSSFRKFSLNLIWTAIVRFLKLEKKFSPLIQRGYSNIFRLNLFFYSKDIWNQILRFLCHFKILIHQMA